VRSQIGGRQRPSARPVMAQQLSGSRVRPHGQSATAGNCGHRSCQRLLEEGKGPEERGERVVSFARYSSLCGMNGTRRRRLKSWRGYELARPFSRPPKARPFSAKAASLPAARGSFAYSSAEV